jgi:type II secretory pathway component GspD/PulD (secretin)
MKTNITLILGLTVGLASGALAQDADAPATDVAKPPAPISEKEKGIRFNFRGVPLEMVLNYMSEAAGFIIVLETRVEGKVDAWSNQPLTKEEAVELLNTILNKNGYAAIRNGRTLKIVSRDEAKTKDIPVRAGSKPEDIAKTDEMVTQIIPVQYANAAQLIQNLSQLLPTYATLTANESGNALVLTATQTDVRRMVEIVHALDTAISSVSTIRVFPLKYADAKELVNAVKELFAPPTTQNNNDRRSQFMNRFFGGGGPGGFGGGGPGGFGGGGGAGGAGGGTRGGSSGGNPAATRVVAVADERSNSLIVSAPEDSLPIIEKLVKEVDVAVADVTELRVFHLKNADPMEMAELLAELFPDDTKSNSNNSQDIRFGGGGFRGGFGQGGFGPGGFGNNNNNRTRNNQSNAQSDRMKKMGRVTAVPDPRTSALIVSAAGDLMPQIAEMIEQLDASRAKKQKVYVYSLENADVSQVEQIVREMFDRNNTTGNRNNANQNSALLNRSQQQQQNQGLQNQGGFGGQGGGGGVGGGQFGR